MFVAVMLWFAGIALITESNSLAGLLLACAGMGYLLDI